MRPLFIDNTVRSAKQTFPTNTLIIRAAGDGIRYVPRALMLDLEPNVIDACRTKMYGSLFKPDNFVKGITGAGNNWAKGFLTEGNEIIEQALDVRFFLVSFPLANTHAPTREAPPRVARAGLPE